MSSESIGLSSLCLQPRNLFDEESMQIPQITPDEVLPTMDQQGNYGDEDIQCKCGAGKLKVLVSHTIRNPNRSFYKCPGISLIQHPRFYNSSYCRIHTGNTVAKWMASNSKRECNYFKWCDQLGQASQSPVKPSFKGPTKIDSSKNTSLNSEHPICRCKAGTCTVLTMPYGKDKGRKYYACFIKKGHGACDHFVWADD